MRKRLKLLKKKYVILHRRPTKLTKRVRKHPAFFVPAITFGILLVVVVSALLIVTRGNPLPELRSSNSRAVILANDNTSKIIPTDAATVGELLERLEITLHEGDVVEPAQDTEIVSDNFKVNVYRALPVTIIDGDTRISALSAAGTPRAMLRQAAIETYAEDILDLKPVDDFITQGVVGQTLTVVRSTPVNLNLYGSNLAMRTQAKTVGELLDEKNITLGEGETVQPSLDASVSSGEPIFVNRKGIRVETVASEVPSPVQYVEDNSLSFGVTAVRQQGTQGEKVTVYQINTETGERAKMQEVTTRDPVARIVARGSYINIPSDKQGVMAAAGISPGDYAYVDYIISRESRWNAAAQNRSSGAYGLCQALPGTKMASAGSDWRTNPVTQLKWCSGYAKGRYGSWQAAYNFWLARHWW